MPKLIVLQGADSGKQFDLSAPIVTLGRHSANAIQLRDDRVSRRHLELRVTPTGSYQLFDLQSGNGTLVNGQLVQVIDLRSGDLIGVGDTVLQYEGGGERPPTVPPLIAPASASRLVVRPGAEQPSAILHTVAAEAGSQILARPDRATGDWLRTRLANLAVLYEASAAVSHILDVDEMLGRIMDLVLRTTGADHGCFILVDPDTAELTPKAIRCRPGLAPGGEFVVSRTVVDHVLREGQGVLVADATTDERFRAGESVARHQLREVICVPMRGRHGTVGTLFLDTRGRLGESDIDPEDALATPAPRLPGAPTRFSEDHLNLAVALAHQAALAVEETRYYQAMAQAEKLAAVGQTIADLSHHIKNIMQGVRFGSDMVRMGLTSDDRELLLKGWKLVEKNQTRIDDLILDMLSYSKDREPSLEPTDLNGLVEDVLDVVRGRAQEAGVTLDWVPAPDLPPVPCDAEGIHRALLNILSNAVDAVDGRPAPRVKVAVALAADGRFAEVTIADNGPGIPPDRLGDIFKPFVSTKGSKGTGLGLPVSRKILREHGGDVTVESAPDQGCRFVLRIPMREMPGPSPPFSPVEDQA